jgi:hypothetical protein
MTGIYKFTNTKPNNFIDHTFSMEASQLFVYTEAEIREYYGLQLREYCHRQSLSDIDAGKADLQDKFLGYRFGLEISEAYGPFAINYALIYLEYHTWKVHQLSGMS